MSPKIPRDTEHHEDKPVDVNIVPASMPLFLQNVTEDERMRMERRLVRKIDLRLLIMVIVIYILNYLDRNNIASAKLAGMQSDLGLHGSQYEVRQQDSNIVINLLTIADIRQHPFCWIYSDAR